MSAYTDADERSDHSGRIWESAMRKIGEDHLAKADPMTQPHYIDRDNAYWRKAYETLVAQTGRDLNDGLGIDPRRKDWLPPLARSTPPAPTEAEAAPFGLYVASRASAPERPEMWRRYRALGLPIISTWIDEAGEGETACNRELWQRIEREVTTASALIFYAEPEDFPLKGALVEVGMALAAGVPVRVVIPNVELSAKSLRPLGSWARHPLVTFHDTVAQAALVDDEILQTLAVIPTQGPTEREIQDAMDALRPLRWKSEDSLREAAEKALATNGEIGT